MQSFLLPIQSAYHRDDALLPLTLQLWYMLLQLQLQLQSKLSFGPIPAKTVVPIANKGYTESLMALNTPLPDVKCFHEASPGMDLVSMLSKKPVINIKVNQPVIMTNYIPSLIDYEYAKESYVGGQHFPCAVFNMIIVMT